MTPVDFENLKVGDYIQFEYLMQDLQGDGSKIKKFVGQLRIITLNSFKINAIGQSKY